MADVIDVLIAEALGEGPDGLAAVAHVINQRAQATGKTPEQIVNVAGQFTGAKNPGRVVAQSMGDPSTRQQVGEIWNGVTSGQIPNPFPGATHFHTPQVSPSWSQQFSNLGQLGNHIFYADGSAPASAPQMAPVSMPTSADQRPAPLNPIMALAANAGNAALQAIQGAAGGPTPSANADWLQYTNQTAIRNQPINEKLSGAMSFLPDMGVTMNVYSGGQNATGKNRVGSTRHDHGNAADVTFMKDGRMLDWNNDADLPILTSIISQARANGVTGIGAGNDYMGAGRFHIGFGNPAVWGAGGKGANAPQWLRDAYNAKPGQMLALADSGGRGVPTQKKPGFWSALTGPMKNIFPGGMNVPAQARQIAANPQVQQAMIGPLMGSLAGRTAIGRHLMNQNIGAAPTVTQGHVGPGTRAIAVNQQGAAPVMLTAAQGTHGGTSGPASEAHGGMNMDVYRANRDSIGSPITSTSIASALSSGRDLYRLA